VIILQPHFVDNIPAHFNLSLMTKIRVCDAEAKRVKFEYIEVFYNLIRRHAKINNQAVTQIAKTYHQNLMENIA
jgi:hemerythrin-like domain-containing protein